MEWPRVISQGLSPALAVGVIAASIMTAVTTKPDVVPANAAVIDAQDNQSLHALWTAGIDKVRASVDDEFLHETGDITGGAWVESRAEPAVIGQTYGKLIVSREFGPSDEADVDDIIARPDDYLVAISVGFRAFTGSSSEWVWARFTPDGKLLDQTGDMPSANQLAAVASTYCHAPLATETATRS